MTLTETEKLTATLATQLLVGYMALYRAPSAYMKQSIADAKKIIELSRESKPKPKPSTPRRIRQWPKESPRSTPIKRDIRD